jgi:chromosome partitioning protein
MAIVYSLASLKGGVSKTLSSINLAAAFSTMGLAGQNKRVLVIDLDMSGNLTASCGVNALGMDQTAYQVVIGKERINDCIIHLDKFDLLPANADLAGAINDFMIMYMQGGKRGEEILSKQIWDIGGDYDMIIIDNQPSFNKLLVASIIASDRLLIPVQPAYYSVLGLQQLIKILGEIKENFNKEVDYRVFISMFDERRVLDRESLALIKSGVGERLLNSKVRNSIALSEATGNKKDIFDYAPSSSGAVDYLELAKEVLSL